MKKNGTFKRAAYACAATMMMLASLSGCGGSKEEETTEAVTEAATEAEATTEAATEAEATTEAATEEEKGAYTLPDKIVFDGNCDVEVVGFEYFDTKDDYEYDIINVYYDITARDDTWRSVKRLYWYAEQEGEELEYDPMSNSTYGNCDYSDSIWMSIQKDVTVRDVVTFAAKKGSTDFIKIGIGEKDGEYEFFEVDPTWDMPDMRTEKYEIAKISDPAVGPGNMPEASFDNFDIKINGIVGYSTGTTLDRNSDIEEVNVVGISYTITSKYDKEYSPFMLFSSGKYVFQDGVSLVDTSAGPESEDYRKTQDDLPLYQKINNGDTVTFTQYYKMVSDSPIEVVFRDFLSKEIRADVVLTVDLSQTATPADAE